MLKVFITSKFKKDIKQIEKQGKDMNLIKAVMNNIQNEISLDDKYKEHELKGDYQNCMECHITPDWLLVYYYGANSVTFYRTGSHSDLF
ncbi:MAG: type II toxin-antitoxin system YafQ family toxin [Clostridiales bacterium]|jgi:mRNA interferase YafQ|nr:type II toxin-antitoxin system YafQ family toxin [Clostridiales bacterium]